MKHPMNPQGYWECIYTTKPADTLSWYRLHLEKSLELIERASVSREAAILDVGGGQSTLVDDLLARGYQNITVLDISQTAIAATQHRLGKRADLVHWIVGDITEICLESSHFDLWHDRAVFHFLTSQKDRAAYVREVTHAVKIGGHAIVGTFGLQGPTRCSGLDVARYDADSLHREFGKRFRLLESCTELHSTPSRTIQQFQYCSCKLE